MLVNSPVPVNLRGILTWMQQMTRGERLVFMIALATFHILLSHIMRIPTMWYVRPAKAQTSLRICAV